MCVNIATAAPLVCLWAEWREARGCELAGRVGRYLAMASVVMLLVGAVLGLAAAALEWTESFKLALGHMGRRVPDGVIELFFSLVLLAIYAAWWRFGGKSASKVARSLRVLLPLLAGTNLLYHFPLLFVVFAKSFTEGSVAGEVLTGAQFREFLVDSETLSRITHFTLASFAVCGTLLMWKASRMWNDDAAQNEDARRVAAWGGRLAVMPTMLQLPVGVWVLAKLPREALRRLMGGDAPGTLLLALSIILALYLLHLLAKAMLVKADRKQLRQGVLLMALVVLLMTGTLLRSRKPSEPPAAKQPPADATSVKPPPFETT
jgi:hypothetical protein